ncbi:MAG: MMPL family transporter, partial [Bacillota bacterium]
YMEAEEKEVFLAELTETLSTLDTEGMDTTITGRSVLDNEMVDGLTSGRFMMTLVGMALVFLALLILYRHMIKALIPLIPIVLIVGWSGLVMYLFDMSYTPITATLGALVIGIGTEFTILIMERYMEEREKGHLPQAAIIIANEKIGQAIFVSVVTTLAGFSALLFSDFVILNNFGMMTVVNISFAFLSTVIVMPVILLLFDPLFIKKQS